MGRNVWTDRSFTELLELLHEILLEGNTLPNSHYEAKKILCPVDMEYRRYYVTYIVVVVIQCKLYFGWLDIGLLCVNLQVLWIETNSNCIF